MRRVVLLGAESTGKSTLAKLLARHFQTAWVEEFAREHWLQKIAARQSGDEAPFWSRADFFEMAREQQRREDAAAQTASRIMVCDTNALATGTWFERYYGHRDEGLDALGAKAQADLYLICAPDVPFVQDGVRDGEAIRLWMHQRFEFQLQHGSTPYVVLSGDFAKRDRDAIAACEKLLGAGSALSRRGAADSL